MKKSVKALTICFSAIAILYIATVHYTDINQVAVVWDKINGSTTLDTTSGFNITAPWVKVARIDTRPQRVCVTSASRSFNCKLVAFDPNGYRDFVRLEGIHYYWLYNRISFNWGYGEEYRGMRDILRGYTFSNVRYPFIKVITELGDQISN